MNHKENKEQSEIADYNVYLQLKQIGYTNIDISKHLSYSKKELGYIISKYTFANDIVYQLQEQEGNYHFNGTLYITRGVNTLLSREEIIEIYRFTKDLVEQHKGIDYLQVFYSKKNNSKLYFIDQLDKQSVESKLFTKEQNYCTLMLSSEY